MLLLGKPPRVKLVGAKAQNRYTMRFEKLQCPDGISSGIYPGGHDDGTVVDHLFKVSRDLLCCVEVHAHSAYSE